MLAEISRDKRGNSLTKKKVAQRTCKEGVENRKFPKVVTRWCKRSFGPREQRSRKGLLHLPKPVLHQCNPILH